MAILGLKPYHVVGCYMQRVVLVIWNKTSSGSIPSCFTRTHFRHPRSALNLRIISHGLGFQPSLWNKGHIRGVILTHFDCNTWTLMNTFNTWLRHSMETFSALLAICAGNSPVPGEFPAQRPVKRSFDVSLSCASVNAWANNLEAGDLRRHRAHYDVSAMTGPHIANFVVNSDAAGCHYDNSHALPPLTINWRHDNPRFQ